MESLQLPGHKVTFHKNCIFMVFTKPGVCVMKCAPDALRYELALTGHGNLKATSADVSLEMHPKHGQA